MYGTFLLLWQPEFWTDLWLLTYPPVYFIFHFGLKRQLLKMHKICYLSFLHRLHILHISHNCNIKIDLSKQGTTFHSSAHNYEWNLERMSNSSQSTPPVGRVLWKELLEEVKLHITPICSSAFKGQVHVFAGWVKIESHLSCRTSAIFKY